MYDFGSDEEYFARRGKGAQVNEEPLRAQGPGFGLEVVGLEGAKPERLIPVLDALQGKAFRMRSVGSIAISLCYVGGGRFDAMLTGRACRSVDAAAGQLIAREGGAMVAFAGEGLDVSLDLDARYHVAAGLDSEMLARARGSAIRRASPGGRAGEKPARRPSGTDAAGSEPQPSPRADRGPVRRLEPGPARGDRRGGGRNRSGLLLGSRGRIGLRGGPRPRARVHATHPRPAHSPAGGGRPSRVGAGRPADAARRLARVRAAHRRRT